MPGISRRPPPVGLIRTMAQIVYPSARADLRPVGQRAGLLKTPQPVDGRRAGQADPSRQVGHPKPRRGLHLGDDPPVEGVHRRFRHFEGVLDKFLRFNGISTRTPAH
jgi:hypothetical protein